jgi:hypothetical protein
MTQARFPLEETTNTYFSNLYTLSYTNSYNISKNESFLPELRSNIKKLNSFKNLNANWNLSNAPTFRSMFIDKIVSELGLIEKQPKIFPTGRESIQFEYEKTNGDYLEFEIFENNVRYLLIKNEKEIEKEISFEDINQLISEFYA